MNCFSHTYEDCTAWTGLNDLDIEGTYVWDHSNASLTFTNWHGREPSPIGLDQAQTRDCIDILRGGGWNDRPCSYLNWFICEKTFWHWYTNNSDILILLLLKSKHTELYCFFSSLYTFDFCYNFAMNLWTIPNFDRRFVTLFPMQQPTKHFSQLNVN